MTVNAPSNPEARKHPRIRIEDHTKLKIILQNKESYNVSSKNISETGLQFEIDSGHDIQIGDKVQIDLYFFERLILSIDVIVRHVHEDIIGGQFEATDHLSKSMLQHFIACLKAA